MNARVLLLGLATFVPGVNAAYKRWKTTTTQSGTESATYCYDVWLKHLVFSWRTGMREMPRTVAELGPGSSLGVGLAALLSGAEKYYALDVLRYAEPNRNLRVFDELVELFSRRTAWRQGKKPAWTDISDDLDPGGFPSHILSDELLAETLSEKRLADIRRSIQRLDDDAEDGLIRYATPWADADVCEPATVDLVVSQSVLEHVTDLDQTYSALGTWVKDGGWMSHQIDFSSHSLTREWNGHWGFSDFMWKLALGKRPFLINRQPQSVHLKLIEESGFSIVTQMQRRESDNSLTRAALRGPWRELSEDDFYCRGLLVQARKGSVGA